MARSMQRFGAVRGLGVHRDIREQGDARIRKRLPDKMERRQHDQRVTQASESVHHDPLELSEVATHRNIG